MPTTTTLLLFAAAALPIALFPGPAVGYVLATTVRRGRRAGLASVAGLEGGNLVHVLAAAVGVSAVLAASATAFTAVKVVGAAWLLWMAVKAWRSRAEGTLAEPAAATSAAPGSPDPGTRAARGGFVVGVLNPKTAVFFLAFLPQFADPAAGPVGPQLLVLGLVFVAVASVGDTCWALAGAELGRVLPRVRLRVLDRVSAGVYAALAAATLTARRATA